MQLGRPKFDVGEVRHGYTYRCIGSHGDVVRLLCDDDPVDLERPDVRARAVQP